MTVVVPGNSVTRGKSLLEVAQAAAPRMGIPTPDRLFGGSDSTGELIASILQDVSERIAKAHDWQILKVEETHLGPGEKFSLPEDYLRMPKDSRLWTSRFDTPLTHIVLSDEWLRLKVTQRLPLGAWTILGGNIEYNPPLASGETVRFYYLKDQVFSDGTTTKSVPTADTDLFVLDDQVLELHLIWEWRHRKGLDYAEDMRTAEIALAQAISRDKGARVIGQARRLRSHLPFAWPGVLG